MKKNETRLHTLRIIRAFMAQFGLDPVKAIRAIKTIPAFLREYELFKKANTEDFRQISFYPCLADRHEESGTGKGHYFNQDLFIAQKIFKANPEKHVDVGSRVDGFVAHVASFRSIEIFDIRPNNLQINNISFQQADFMEPLPDHFREYSDSVSCLHALEHFGLGRYGDKVAADGYQEGLKNLASLCKTNGTLYLSFPIGPQRIEFNAHRVFSTRFAFELLQKTFEIKGFSFVDDSGELNAEAEITRENIDNNYGCHFGCGIFELKKSSI